MKFPKQLNWALAGALLTVCSAALADWGHKASHPFGAWGIDFSDQDTSIRPGDNFFAFQNGKWLARVQFGPNEKAQAFWREVRLLTPQRMQELLNNGAAPGTGTQSIATPLGKASAAYRAYMDDATLEAKGMAPLEPQLEAIRAVQNKSQLAYIMGQIAGPGTVRAWTVYGRPTGWSFFRLDNVAQDRQRLDRNSVYMAAGGLGLPTPAYYTEPQFADMRKAYVTYITKTLELEHWPDAADMAQQILDLEIRVAEVSWTPEQMLDQVKTYNPVTIKYLTTFAPGFDWRSFMNGAEISDVPEVVIDAKSAFPKIAALYASAPLNVLKARQAFGLADQRSDLLNAAMLKAALDFRGDAIGDGVYTGGAPRPLKAEKEAEAIIPDIMSSLYVERYSSPAIKAEVVAMAANMRRALDKRLSTLSWMSPASRATARKKLAAMKFHIGFPDYFDDYAELEIRNDDLYGNNLRSAAYQWHVLVGRLHKPFDPSIWQVQPEYANFNYVTTTNTVEIPAALLVSPFFDIKADKAVNYGSDGSILGSLIASPFFTRKGLEYDLSGRLHPWLAPQEMAHFLAIRATISKQYSAVESLPGLHLQGELIADEALGDLAGLEIALDAYRASFNGVPPPVIDGYTGDQRFFLGRAQMWQAKFVDSFVRSQTVTGSNEPPFMRVNGLLPNMDSWYAAFAIKPGEKLYVEPVERVHLW